MTWTCAAIDHGVTIFPNGKIGPCCQIDASYLKPISELKNSNRFADLHGESAPTACDKCTRAEFSNLPSYREFFNKTSNDSNGLQFIDIRNTNLCNLKCRYCGPHFSSQWAEELDRFPIIEKQQLTEFKKLLITDAVHWMYFTGGEPFISNDHWELLSELIDKNLASNISLMYNTNLTTIRYKDKNIIDIWKKFKTVSLNCSIDAIGMPLEYIRSGSNWKKIESNLLELHTHTNVNLTLTPVLSILNIWFIDQLYAFAQTNKIPVLPIVLTGPDYLAIDVIPDELTSLALNKIDSIGLKYNIDEMLLTHLKNLINNNINQCLFQHTVSHVLLLDNLRNEKLFDLLPFKSVAIDKILKNNEYE
jgi:sulfatase maturation enzyme AslB (radical SAM superfamily)